MKPIYSMDDTQWDKLIRNVSHYFDDLTIKRGFQYFKQERVQQLSMPAPERIQAVVEGSEPYRVEIQLDAFLSSHCSCPVQGSCKHMIAVLLDYTRLQNRSIPTLVNAKSTAMRKTVPPAAAQTQVIQQANRLPSMSIEEWHELFELCHAPLSDNTPNTQYVKDTKAAIYQVKPSLSPMMEQLFSIHVYLFILVKLVKQTQHQTQNQNAWRTSGYYMGFHTQIAADDVKETIERILTSEIAITTEPELWPLVIQTLAYLRRRMLSESQSLTYFADLYTLLWIKWIHPALTDTTMYIEELKQLLIAKEELGSGISQPHLLSAQVRMYFYLEKDNEVWSMFENAAGNRAMVHPESLYAFMYELSTKEAWSRLVNWLVKTGPLLNNFRRDSLKTYSAYWETAIQHAPESESLMWEAFASMLPFSREIYQEALLTHERWQQWMDYHLSIGSLPEDFRVSELQPIEKHAPELLLPFYHQAVERFILEKNRHSYKAAVKLLKRLYKLYKKMKQEDRWELFFTTFSGRHSRLRALQEELKKGKLLS